MNELIIKPEEAKKIEDFNRINFDRWSNQEKNEKFTVEKPNVRQD